MIGFQSEIDTDIKFQGDDLDPLDDPITNDENIVYTVAEQENQLQKSNSETSIDGDGTSTEESRLDKRRARRNIIPKV
jgi:hypothetical protein